MDECCYRKDEWMNVAGGMEEAMKLMHCWHVMDIPRW